MSGQEALKGFHFQTLVMLLCFLEQCTKGVDFQIVGEPAKNIDTGDIVDIALTLRKSHGSHRKLIQVKRTLSQTIIKNVLNEFFKTHIERNEDIELWFAEYILANKMKLIDSLDKLKTAILTPNFAENEIQCDFEGNTVIASLDSSIEGFSLNNNHLKLSNYDILNGDEQVDIINKIYELYDTPKKHIISKIKHSLNDTLGYRRYIFLNYLDPEQSFRDKIIDNGFDFFKRITIRQLSEKDLNYGIAQILPDSLTITQKEIIKDVLFSYFYRISTEGRLIQKSDGEQLIMRVTKEFGHPCDHIIWDNESIHGTRYSDIGLSVPEGDYSIGEL